MSFNKREVSTAKCLVYVERLLIQIKSNSGPASIAAHSDTCPFKTTRCFIKLRKSMTVFKMLPDMPFCLSLYLIPLCHTLSNALDVSKNIPLTCIIFLLL